MGPLMSLSSLLLVFVASAIALRCLSRIRSWAHRRTLQVLVLAAPVSSLVVGLLDIRAVAMRICFLNTVPWGYAVGVAGLLGMGAVALGGIGLGGVRLATMYRVVARRGVPADPELQAIADRLAARLRTARPAVRLVRCDRPLALTWGLRRPTVLLSSWIVEHLDSRELESVLAHELGHAARHDYAVIWLATVLRDAFFYLPTSQAAYRHLQLEKELACDDLAVTVTHRPLALASALAKVWQHLLSGPSVQPALPFADAGPWLESRIERLAGPPGPERTRGGVHAVPVAIGTSALIGLVTLEIGALSITLSPMLCSPTALLWKLF